MGWWQSRRGGEITRAFHRAWYDHAPETWKSLSWAGIPVQKCPFDLWIYQEILWQCRPEAIIETGTLYGGSALFLAHVLDHIGHGRIVTIDHAWPEPGWVYPAHPRITYLHGDSVADATLAQVRAWLASSGASRCMVVLDSDHRAVHVLAELERYAPFVTPGQYCIVEDTNLNGYPVYPGYGAGPAEAVRAFCARHPEFQVDPWRERLGVTFNPGGYLRRVDAAESVVA